MNNYYQKYKKYKKKYLDLKIQSGGAGFTEALAGNTIRSPEQLDKMSYNEMISNLTGKEIIRNCTNNKQLCTQIIWTELLRERAINFNPLSPLPIPKMCSMMADDRQKEACTKFYHYTKGGKIVIWGGNKFGQRNNLPADTAYIAIACGRNHSVALKNDGTIVTWGGNNFGQRNDSPTDDSYIAIACGRFHSLALKYTID